MKKNKKAMYEDVIQKMIKEKKLLMSFLDITKIPWLEIDFKKDLNFAKNKIIKKINE